MNLETIHRTLHSALRGEKPVDEVAAALGVNPARLAIYRRFVETHVRTALDANFPTLRAIFGDTRWAKLAHAYDAAHPPHHWELNRAAADFAEFLERDRANEAELEIEPWHISVAELELTLCEIAQAIVEVPANTAVPTVNPSLVILELSHAIGPHVAAGLRGEPIPPPPADDEPSRVLVYQRPPALRAVFQVADDGLLFALKVTHDGLTARDAATATGLPIERVESELRRAVERGVIIAPAP